jgi:hypothetical protein
MSNRRALSMLAIAALALGCAGPTAPTSSPGASTVPIVLRPAPADLGCDAMRPAYDVVTFHIDPAGEEQVFATTDTGLALLTYWSAGFVPGSSDDPTVRDPAGQVVARDGDVLPIPPAAWPRLHGYFVCPSTDAVYVLIEDPA